MKFPTVSFLDFFNGLSLDFQGIDFVERGWCFVQIQHSKTSLGPSVEVATCSLFFNAISLFLRKAWSHFRTFHWSSWYFKQKIRLKNHLALLLLKKNTCQNPGISSIYLHFHYQPSNRFSNPWPKISPSEAGGCGRVSLLASDVTWAPWVPCCWPPGWFKWAHNSTKQWVKYITPM